MKKLLLAFLVFQYILITTLEAQVKLPAISPVQTIRQEFGLGEIEITYSRPGTRGRKVFGDLVPYGKLWRTGANAATRLHFSDPVEINGRKLDSGSYVLYTIPGLESWEIIINKDIKNAGTDGYKESEDVARFKTDPVKAKTRIESFTIQLGEIKPESCELQLMWEKKLIILVITTNIKEKIRNQLDAGMLTNKKPYWEAAQFYNEYDLNFIKALDNINKATEANPRSYWMFLYKAKIQKETGDVAGALQSSIRSLALSKEFKNEDYVKMNEKFQQELKRR